MHQYLRIADEIYRINQTYGLSYFEMQLLHLVATAHVERRSIFVSDLLGNKEIASQATLHKSLKRLLEIRFVEKNSLESDNRCKLLSLSPEAIKYYRKLNLILKSNMKIFK